jgi:capsular polysaccharide biosynthesis protein
VITSEAVPRQRLPDGAAGDHQSDDRRPVTVAGTLRRRGWLVAAVVGLAVAIAALASFLMPTTYKATAALFMDTGRTSTSFDLGLQTGQLIEHNYITLATTRSVLLQACATPGVHCSAAELAQPERFLAKRVGATVLNGTSLIGITGSAPAPDEAAALANAVAAAVIDADNAQVVRLLKPAQASLDAELQRLTAAMAKARPTDLPMLQSEYANAYSRQLDLKQLQSRLTNIATIAEAAQPPGRPAAPDPPRYLVAALMAGLCLGLFAALLVERFDNRSLSPEDLARVTGAPVILAPRRSKPRSSIDRRSYALAYASLFAQRPQTRALLVAGASARDHTDGVAVQLGAVAAEAGQRVFVVESDGGSNGFRWPHPEVTGLTTITPTPDGVLAAPRAVAEIQSRYEFGSSNALLVIAVPSPDASPTALMLAHTANRAMVVATAGVTRFSEARRTADLLRQSEVEVAAALLLTGSLGTHRA